MARSKKSRQHIQKEQQRLTWTRFRLPRGIKWPRWNIDETDDLGPLANVPGCLKVWVGRMVDDPEQALLLILWESVDAMEQFERTFEYQCFRRGLGLEPMDKRFMALRWTHGFEVRSALEGRVTVTKLVLPLEYVPKDWGHRDAVYVGFPHNPPNPYRDPRAPANNATAWMGASWRVACLWADKGEEKLPSSDEVDKLCYHFFKWYLEGDRLQEESLANNGLTKEQWTQAVERMMPPVKSWEQERWEFEAAPSFVIGGDDYDEEDVMEDAWDEQDL